MEKKCFFEDGCLDGCRVADMKLLLEVAIGDGDTLAIGALGRTIATASIECPNVSNIEQDQETMRFLAC